MEVRAIASEGVRKWVRSGCGCECKKTSRATSKMNQICQTVLSLLSMSGRTFTFEAFIGCILEFKGTILSFKGFFNDKLGALIS